MDPLFAAVIAVAIAFVGIVVGYLIAGQRGSAAATQVPAGAPGAPRPRMPRRAGLQPDTALPTRELTVPPVAVAPPADPRPLINALIGSYDTSAEESVRAYIAQQLTGVGVFAVLPEPGSAFDAATQRCVATESDSGGEPGTVVRVDRPGWLGPAGPIRMPDVTVVAQLERD